VLATGSVVNATGTGDEGKRVTATGTGSASVTLKVRRRHCEWQWRRNSECIRGGEGSTDSAGCFGVGNRDGTHVDESADRVPGWDVGGLSIATDGTRVRFHESSLWEYSRIFGPGMKFARDGEFRGVALRKKKNFRRDFDMAPSDENERAPRCTRATPSLPGILSMCMHRVIDNSSMTRKQTAWIDGMRAPLSLQSDSSSLWQSTKNDTRNMLSLSSRGRLKLPQAYVVRVARTSATV
jgi:hypothetical protein